MNHPLPALNPADLVGYLASRGWERQGLWRGAAVWTTDASGRLLIPPTREYPDDDDLLRDAVRKLAELEDRTEQEVLLDITEPMVDTHLYRTWPETPSGTTTLLSGLKAVQGIHDLLKTAARTAEEGTRLLYLGRRSKHVDAFLHRVQLGTARPGSYILTARIPVADPVQLPLTGEDTSGRRIGLQLHQAIISAHAAAKAALREGRADAFDNHVENGVSANLCEALGDLGGSSRDRSFEVVFSWARGRPVDLPSEPITFTGEMAHVLHQAGRQLTELAKSGQARVVGYVENLQLRPGEPPRIKINGELRTPGGTMTRSVWVIVSQADYDQAFEVQARSWRLSVVGELVPAQRRLEMRPAPSGIEILRN